MAMNDSIRLMMASFNWMSHCRKDIIRNDIRDFAVGELCGWDTPIGESMLFPFDVSKKADEARKTKKLGFPVYKQRRQFRPQTKSYGNQSGGYSGGYKTSNNAYRQKKKPFLGPRKGPHHQKKKPQSG